MEMLFYNDIETAINTRNFTRVLTKLDTGISHDDTMLLVRELIRNVNGDISTYDELVKLCDKANNLICERTLVLEDMPNDIELTKDEVLTIMHNLQNSMEELYGDC